MSDLDTDELVVDRSRAWRLEDILDAPADGRRREIIDGVLYVMPSPKLTHQRIVLNLCLAIRIWCERHGGEVFPTLNVDRRDGSHLEPDVIMLAPDEEHTDDWGVTEHPPYLVAEVLSPSTRHYDLEIKRAHYADLGVREYWVIDPDARDARIWTAGTGEPRRFTGGDQVTSPLLPGLSLEVADLFAPPGSTVRRG